MKAKIFFQKTIILFIAIALIISFDYWLFSPRKINQENEENEKQKTQEPIVEIDKEEENEKTDGEKKEELIKTEEIPEKVYFKVPFVPQAPRAIWDDLHNEACEEAALIIAKYWLENKELTYEKMDEEILNSVAWQEEKWGGHYDLPTDKVIELAQEYFNIEGIRAVYNIENIQRIKKEIASGNLVLVPCAGRILDNPYYRQPGPVYHMLVIIGFDSKGIITNDPGTRRGKDFRYTEENLFNAIHDWPAGIGRSLEFGQVLPKDKAAKEILKGQKVMIIVGKSE